MQINGPGTDGTTTRQGYLHPPQPGQQRPQHQKGGPHFSDQLVGGLITGYIIHIDKQFRIYPLGLDAEVIKYITYNVNVFQRGDVLYYAPAFG